MHQSELLKNYYLYVLVYYYLKYMISNTLVFHLNLQLSYVFLFLQIKQESQSKYSLHYLILFLAL